MAPEVDGDLAGPLYSEEELLPMSGLQHLLYCERQCALIHVERIWAENMHTARGLVFHDRAHSGRREVRGNTVVSFGLPIRSLRLGLVGVTDAVELTYRDRTLSMLETVLPIEYKSGRPKKGSWDEVQLVAQAVALEEMLEVSVSHGAVYYGSTRRRHEVVVGKDLRDLTQASAARFHELVRTGITPRAVYSAQRCDRCSLLDMCRPRVFGQKSALSFMRRAIEAEVGG